MTSHAYQQAERTGTIDGPLLGYHREWYVVRPGGELADMGRVKVGEPREDVLWFDRRYFTSEDEVLVQLDRLGMPRIPPVRSAGADGPLIHGFVEGKPLNEIAPAGTAVKPVHLRQIMTLFRRLARVRPKTVAGWNIGTCGDQAPRRDANFLQDLIRFSHDEVHEKRLADFGVLFEQLGIPSGAFSPESRLAAEASELTSRPFRLLHGDLHRANFIVDPQGQLWTIDWELATVGDPLYDLATHLHLMRYPTDQERTVRRQWKDTMSEVLPGALEAFDADLDRYLAFKRVQSVHTDVVRHAIAVRTSETPRRRDERLQHTAKVIEDTLVRARDDLNLRAVPGSGSIEDVYRRFCSTG
ncbi:aminoglycoside phosphotransferase family protein [Streptomyces bathyalis]|uniref:Aminoglycoside phosphotransferase family protein n=1 Tax=Streptomyces bathyalis TaxID=2710756 RepID=A0A7T1WSZ8_9ACTN|nr:aminoglycoside phosphotransferase family protein [Streptomyces bathyalis]QPP08064.1 aminoglycoside phosphotransferase family protein [Streptomyces bathyalis]